MTLDPLFFDPTWVSGSGSYAVDFFLAFVFFTALCFAVLGRVFDHHRSAVAMSAALAAALSLGLVAWEIQSGWRVRDLGPVSAGFALIVLAMVIHQALRKLGGDWAGAAVALGAALLISTVLRVPYPMGDGTAGALGTLALTLGAGLWFAHQLSSRTVGRGAASLTPPPLNREAKLAEARETQRQVHEIDDVRRIERRLDQSLEAMSRATRTEPPGPEATASIRERLAALIPDEGQVTRRLADLRARCVLAEKGHLGRLRSLTDQIPRMTPRQARAGARRVRVAYREAGFYRRLTRLDAAAAEVERRILRLTVQAETMARVGQTDQLHRLIEDARKLQHQALRLSAQIERDEKKLLAMVFREVQQAMGDAA